MYLEVRAKGYKWLRKISINEPDALEEYLGNGFLRFRYSSINNAQVSITDRWGRLKLSPRQRREIAYYYENRLLGRVEEGASLMVRTRPEGGTGGDR